MPSLSELLSRRSPSNQVVTGSQARRTAQLGQRRLNKANSRFRTLSEIASRRAEDLPPSLVGNVPEAEDESGILNVAGNIGSGVLDVLQRANFVAAGIAEELLVKRRGPIAALGRATQELLSGIGQFQGEKDTFRDVLDGLDAVPETTLGDVFDAVEDIPVVGGANLRGSLGLALDIFLDPLTYLTGGGAALARVPKAFRGTKVANKARLLDDTEKATQAFTRRGRKLRDQFVDKNLKEIRESPKLVPELMEESDRLAIEAVQDDLMSGLLEQGVSAGRSGELSEKLVKDVLSKDSAAIKSLNTTLNRLNSRTAKKVRRSLGMEETGRRSEIAATIAEDVRLRASEMLRSGLPGGDDALGLLAGDVALRRATDQVLSLTKTTPGLVRDIAPLRMSIPFSDIGFNIGPAGKGLTEWVVQSGVTAKTIAVLQTVMPQGVANAGYKAAAKMRGAVDMAGRLFNESWTGRRLAGFNTVRKATLNGIASAVAKNTQNMGGTQVAAWYNKILKATRGDKAQRQKIFREFAIAVDTGNLSRLDSEARVAAEEFNRIMAETVAIDVRKGLMQAKNVRTKGYFPHFLDASEKVVRKLQAHRPGRTGLSQAVIGRHAEARGFDTILDIERAERALGVSAGINFDPMVALVNRTNTTVEGSMFADFYESVAQEFGKAVMPWRAADYLELTRPLVDDASKAFRVAERMARNRRFQPNAATLNRLIEKHGKGAAGEFLRQRLAQATGFKSAMAFLQKYEGYEHLLPRIPGLNAADLAPDGSVWREMPHEWRGFEGGVLLPESAADTIQGMRVKTARQPEVDEFLGFFDRFQNTLKVHLTAMFPAFHFRNAYSNIAQNFLDIGLSSLNPITHIRSAKLAALTMNDTGQVLSKIPAKYLTPDLNQIAWTTPGGRGVTLREAAEELKRNNVVRDSKDIFEGVEKVRGRPRTGAVPIQGEGPGKKLLTFWSRAGRNAGGFIENEARIALYTQLRRRGLTQAEATERVNKLLFDYQSLTEFERVYLKRAIPFYVWTKKNIALQASAIRNMPGRVVNISKPFNNEDEEVTGAMMEWQTGQFRIQLDRNGKDVRMLTGIDLPIMSIDRLLPIGKIVRGQFGEALKGVVSQMTPMLKVPAELAANEEFFSGRSLDRATSNSIGRLLDPEGTTGKAIPDVVRRWLAFQKTTPASTGRPIYSFDGQKFHVLFKSWMVSRYLTSSDAWFRRASQDRTLATNLLATMTSLKLQDMNLDEQMARKMEERTRKLEDILSRAGIIKRTSTSFELKDSPRFRQRR